MARGRWRRRRGSWRRWDRQGPPVRLDRDGDGIEITELDRSTVFMDASGSGLKHRTAWAGNGDGVLFYDADGSGTINDDREYVFTEWGARRSRNGPGDRFRQRTREARGTAKFDLQTLRSGTRYSVPSPSIDAQVNCKELGMYFRYSIKQVTTKVGSAWDNSVEE